MKWECHGNITWEYNGKMGISMGISWEYNLGISLGNIKIGMGIYHLGILKLEYDGDISWIVTKIPGVKSTSSSPYA